MKRAVFLSLSVILFPPAAFSGTCALCRQTLAMGGSDGLLQGFYWSILLIAGMPLLILACIVFHFYRMAKKHKSDHVSP